MQPVNENEKKPTHSHGRECVLCKGLCKHVKVNSLTSFEEIQEEILRRRRLEQLEK